MTQFEVSFDLLDAFTREVLPYCVSGITTRREEISPVLIVYSLRDHELGDLGALRLRKLINGGTEIIFTYPPSPDYLDIYNWVKQRNGQVQIGNTQLTSVEEQLPTEQFDQVMKLAKIHLTKNRETRKREVMDAFTYRLEEEQNALIGRGARYLSAQPEEPILPPEPKSNGGNISEWFDWYHQMLDAGYKCKLRKVAEKSGYSYGYVKQIHQKRQSKPDLTKI